MTQRDHLIVMMYGLAGGFGDATSLILYKTFTGHATGNLVLMMVALAHNQWHGVAQRILAISIFLSATKLGVVLTSTRNSSAWLFLTQILLLLPLEALYHWQSHSTFVGIALLSASLGLQNGVITKIHNVGLHSTFVSGDLTNLLKTPSNTTVREQSKAVLLRWLVGGFALGALSAASVLRFVPGAAFFTLMCILGIAFMFTLSRGSERSMSGCSSF